MHFIRLIRPLNLIIVALTMFGVKSYLGTCEGVQVVHDVNFYLLVISTIFIAAGGNVINDYFDVRADRVNRPKKVIIGRHIKRRWAIVLHWCFNVLAFVTALYLGWFYQSFLFIIIHVSSITLLWWYSVSLKKIPLVGNIAVSLLTVLVIYLCFRFVLLDGQAVVGSNLPWDGSFKTSGTVVIYLFMCMAFLHNLLREIIKDAEDLAGDKLINARTIPMVISNRKTIILVVVGLLIFPLMYMSMYVFSDRISSLWNYLWPISIAALNNVVTGVVAMMLPEQKAITYIKHSIKLSMMLALIYLFLYQ